MYPRSRQPAPVYFSNDLRADFSSPYSNSRIFKAKTTNTNSNKWNLKCQDRFFKAIQRLGGIDKASPEAVVALTNIDLVEKIADQMHIHREYFKKMELQQENPNSKNVTITWTKDRITRLLGVVKRLGGVYKVSAQEIFEAMKEDINDLTVDDIAERLYTLKGLFKQTREEEGSRRGYGPVRRGLVFSVRSGPYGRGSVGPRTKGSNSKGVEFVWTLDRHKRFVDAVEKLGGVVKAKAGAILEVMKEEEGLTRLIVRKHLEGLRRLLMRHSERLPYFAESNLYNVHGTNGNGSGSNSTGMATGDQAKEASSWSNSGSFEDVLNNFRELNLKPI